MFNHSSAIENNILIRLKRRVYLCDCGKTFKETNPFTDVLCVDEVYSKHCGFHKYCFVTYSPQLDKILDVLPSRHKEDLCGYFGRIPLEERKRVKYFSMDLYEVYRQVAHLCFPDALVCADHFHVIKNISDCFNSVAKINNAAEMLDELIIKFHNSKIDEYKKAYRLLKNWRTEIINSFHESMSMLLVMED